VKRNWWLAAVSLAGLAEAASAGPPYVTDDPVATEPGHWETFAFTSGEGRSSDLDEDVGVDINFGASRARSADSHSAVQLQP
jgi:hypothetical protein